MIEEYDLIQDDKVFEQLIEKGALDEFKSVLAEFWLPPHLAADRITGVISSLGGERLSRLLVIVSGETKNVSLYLIGTSHVMVLTPFSIINENILLQEVFGADALPKGCSWHIFPTEARLLDRLTLPKVLLVNPCVIENFPIPRLCLSISLLAGYLRKYQKADVRIMDMQVGVTVKDVLEEALRLRPAMFGMSISYGQKGIALSILDSIYQAKRVGTIDPLVVIGNILPASFPKEFIEAYPGLVIACGEGEMTVIGLAEYIAGRRELSSVPGLAYSEPSGHLKITPKIPVPVESIPLPALDTIADLSRTKGALTLEISRGCQWNVCTFCPREHKASHWKTFSTAQILEQFTRMSELCNRFGLKKHIFLADEEFMGGMADGRETERIAEVARGLINRDIGMKFDAEARVDQVYNPKMGLEWHVKRLEMWHLCGQAGLDRLFMGIESGSDTQLRRYGKGIKAEHSVIAIRLLSALGIPLRFGFITFDQLMVGLRELKENIAFLERTDAFMNRIDVEAYGYERLFNLLVNDEDFIATHSSGRPLYSGVSYMLATMEVLINSSYKTMLKHSENMYAKRLLYDEDTPDTNMGRYRAGFVDELIGDISTSCQRWIDRHFSVAYTVKSLYKVASQQERKHLMAWMISYRRISLFLLKAFIYIFDDSHEGRQMVTATDIESELSAPGLVEALRGFARSRSALRRAEVIENCLDSFERLVEAENIKLAELMLRGSISDTPERRLSAVLKAWHEHSGGWALINDPEKTDILVTA